MRAAVVLATLVLLAVAACERREGAVSGPYLGGGTGANVRQDSTLR